MKICHRETRNFGEQISKIRRLVGLTAAVILLLMTTFAPIPALAEGATGTTNTGTSAEAWYATAGACEPPVDCSPLAPAPATPYPEDTLHVGINGGKGTSATYLQLDTSAVPLGSQISGGTLTLPVDPEPKDGSVAPETAKLVACVVTEPIEDAEGSLAKPPKADCKAASAPAQFKPGKKPTFTVDLAAFTAQWVDGGDAGLSIQPAPEAEQARATWHVTFWGKENKAPDAEPIGAQLVYVEGSDDSFLPPLDPAPFDEVPAPVDTGLAPAPLPDTEPLAAPPPTGPPPADSGEPGAAPEAEPELAPQAAPPMRRVGYPQRVAFLFPLLLLAGFGVTGLVLTKKLDLQR